MVPVYILYFKFKALLHLPHICKLTCGDDIHYSIFYKYSVELHIIQGSVSANIHVPCHVDKSHKHTCDSNSILFLYWKV